MFAISDVKYFCLIFLLNSCQSKVNNLDINNKHLDLVNGIMLYEEKPYSGTLFSKTDTLITYQTTYLKGKKHGKEQKFFFNGDLAELRFYTNGKESGTHQAWWNKEQLKFEYHFDNTGNYIGVQHEWYGNGQLLKEFNYINGKQDGTQKLWDFSGKINTNYVVINGERFGLIGTKICKPDNYVD